MRNRRCDLWRGYGAVEGCGSGAVVDGVGVLTRVWDCALWRGGFAWGFRDLDWFGDSSWLCLEKMQ